MSVGDYTLSVRNSLETGNVLLPLDGSPLDGSTYPQLAALFPSGLVSLGDGSIANTVWRSQCITADGTKGYVGTMAATAEIYEIDYVAGTSSLVRTMVTYTQQVSALCCSDDGQKIYGFCRSTTTAGIVHSQNGGLTWTELAVTGAPAVDNVGQPASTTSQIAQIACNASGTHIVLSMQASNSTDFTLVWESTDSGATWAEILTPRVAMVNPLNCREAIISANLGSHLIMGAGNSNFLVSLNGAAFVNQYANLPANAQSDQTRFALSPDGTIIFATRSGTDSPTQEAWTSTDAVNWTPVTLTLFDGVTNGDILAVFFSPLSNDKIYAYVEDTDKTLIAAPDNVVLVEFTISTGAGVTATGGELTVSEPALANSRYMSDVKLDGDIVRVCYGDPVGADIAATSGIVDGVVLPNAATDDLPYKIVADAP